MKFVLSPAKSLDYETAALTDRHSEPAFMSEAAQLIGKLKEFDANDIKGLMGVSEKIAELNVGRYHDWSHKATPRNAKQAVYAFTGDVYTGISITSAEQAQVDYIDKNVIILSGLYGALKPLDLMQPYRLEMGTKLETSMGANLYQFWGDTVTNYVNSALSADQDDALVNLASNEYYKVLQPKSIRARIITPIFKDQKNGSYKIVSFYAKKARGLMVRYAADNQVTDVEQLKSFDYAGYAFNPELSDGDNWVFTRDHAPE